MTAQASMSTNDKVLTLLAEYNSLRSEIMQRNSVFNQYCVIAIPATVAAVTLVYTAYPPAGVLVLAVIVFLLFFVFRLIEYDTLAAAKRVRELETVLNEMAGEKLVCWETDNGLNTLGYRHRLAYVLEPLMRGLKSLAKGKPGVREVEPL